MDDYVGYVATQSEAAVRQLAGTYPYDSHDEHGGRTEGVSLREAREQVNMQLEEQLTSLQESCATEEVYSNPDKLRDAQFQIAEVERELEVANEEWANWD